jgi:hypothetical protein
VSETDSAPGSGSFVEMLSTDALFSSVGEADLFVLATRSKIRYLEPGEAIVVEGEPAESLSCWPRGRWRSCGRARARRSTSWSG